MARDTSSPLNHDISSGNNATPRAVKHKPAHAWMPPEPAIDEVNILPAHSTPAPPGSRLQLRFNIPTPETFRSSRSRSGSAERRTVLRSAMHVNRPVNGIQQTGNASPTRDDNGQQLSSASSQSQLWGSTPTPLSIAASPPSTTTPSETGMSPTPPGSADFASQLMAETQSSSASSVTLRPNDTSSATPTQSSSAAPHAPAGGGTSTAPTSTYQRLHAQPQGDGLQLSEKEVRWSAVVNNIITRAGIFVLPYRGKRVPIAVAEDIRLLANNYIADLFDALQHCHPDTQERALSCINDITNTCVDLISRSMGEETTACSLPSTPRHDSTPLPDIFSSSNFRAYCASIAEDCDRTPHAFVQGPEPCVPITSFEEPTLPCDASKNATEMFGCISEPSCATPLACEGWPDTTFGPYLAARVKHDSLEVLSCPPQDPTQTDLHSTERLIDVRDHGRQDYSHSNTSDSSAAINPLNVGFTATTAAASTNSSPSKSSDPNLSADSMTCDVSAGKSNFLNCDVLIKNSSDNSFNVMQPPHGAGELVFTSYDADPNAPQLASKFTNHTGTFVCDSTCTCDQGLDCDGPPRLSRVATPPCISVNLPLETDNYTCDSSHAMTQASPSSHLVTWVQHAHSEILPCSCQDSAHTYTLSPQMFNALVYSELPVPLDEEDISNMRETRCDASTNFPHCILSVRAKSRSRQKTYKQKVKEKSTSVSLVPSMPIVSLLFIALICLLDSATALHIIIGLPLLWLPMVLEQRASQHRVPRQVLVDSSIQLEKLTGKCLTLSFTQGWDPGGSALFTMVTTTQALPHCSGPGGRRFFYTSVHHKRFSVLLRWWLRLCTCAEITSTRNSSLA
jgi:hypothetical protein